MKSLYITTMMVAVVASPAFAQSSRNAQRPSQAQDRATSHDVYAGQRRLGTDPDPNSRLDLLRQQNWR